MTSVFRGSGLRVAATLLAVLCSGCQTASEAAKDPDWELLVYGADGDLLDYKMVQFIDKGTGIDHAWRFADGLAANGLPNGEYKYVLRLRGVKKPPTFDMHGEVEVTSSRPVVAIRGDGNVFVTPDGGTGNADLAAPLEKPLTFRFEGIARPKEDLWIDFRELHAAARYAARLRENRPVRMPSVERGATYVLSIWGRPAGVCSAVVSIDDRVTTVVVRQNGGGGCSAVAN